MIKYYQHNRASGQTLIEVLITVLIITVGTIALIRFQGYLAYSNSLNKQQANATNLAMKKMENLRDYHTKQTTAGFNAYNDITSGSETATVNNASYTTTWTVSTFTNPDYKTIVVVVSWTDIRGSNQSVNLETNVAEGEPYRSGSIM